MALVGRAVGVHHLGIDRDLVRGGETLERGPDDLLHVPHRIGDTLAEVALLVAVAQLGGPSFSPVEAPLGTAARPCAPLDRTTSASTVGLPRLSRISRAWTSMMVAMAAILPRRQNPVNAAQEGTHRRGGTGDERIAIIVGKPGRGDRRADADLHPPRARHDAAFGQDAERPDHDHRHHRVLRHDGEHEGALLERLQAAIAAARTSGKTMAECPARSRRPAVSNEATAERPIVAIDGDLAADAKRRAEDGYAEQLTLGHEAQRPRQRHEQHPHVDE
jgi:hypothetical protein